MTEMKFKRIVFAGFLYCLTSATGFSAVGIYELNSDEVPREAINLTGAQWIWRCGLSSTETVRLELPPEKAFFEVELTRPQKEMSAVWFCGTADDQLTLLVNGKSIYSSADWVKINAVEFSDLLTNNVNIICVEAQNDGAAPNAGGFVGKILIQFKDGSSEPFLTGETWRSSVAGSLWAPPVILGTMGMMPWGLLGHSFRAMPENFPQFIVPGEEEDLRAMRDLFFEHYRFFPYGTLWDLWMAKSLIWPAAESGFMTERFGSLLGGRLMADDGYVSTHQHRGMAHDLGWPFPLWTQVAGWGWHFSGSGNPYNDPAFGIHIQHSLDGWRQEGVSNIAYTHLQGLHAELAAQAVLETPPLKVSAMSAPYVRLEWWAEGLADAKPYLEWTTEKHPAFSPARRLYFDAPQKADEQLVSMIPLKDVTTEDEVFTRFRIGFGNEAPAKVIVQALMTAVDSRHNINNAVWVMGCSDYICQTGDIEFLKHQVARMRKALQYAMDEFQTLENGCVNTPWRGHDGRSGVIYQDGKKVIRPGFGVGNNYWDLLPFGGKDFQATIWLSTALERLADLEGAIATHPKWGIASGMNPEELRAHAEQMRSTAQKIFWNKKTGRFVSAVDMNGDAHDYGFAVLNLDAVSSGMATSDQERSILDWISGKRIVEGDTSVGDDIYRWRFGPRATTLRNTNYYSSVWSAPETLPFGDQVQDGGAVLGFSYYDLMSRLKVYGPDNAWARLKEILAWHREVQAEGGARAYYAKPGRGSLQGGGTAGGLGIDQEFMESALLPQIMLYGFMGFEPKIDGFALNPQLPSSWPSFRITDVCFQNGIYDMMADIEKVVVTMKSGAPGKLVLYLDERVEVWMAPGKSYQFNKPGRGE